MAPPREQREEGGGVVGGWVGWPIACTEFLFAGSQHRSSGGMLVHVPSMASELVCTGAVLLAWHLQMPVCVSQYCLLSRHGQALTKPLP
jgi:hypothetical protein